LLSPGGGGSVGGGPDPGSAAAVGVGKPERPSSLAPGKLTRRLLCYHSEHCMSHNSPPRPSNLVAAVGTTGESALLLRGILSPTLHYFLWPWAHPRAGGIAGLQSPPNTPKLKFKDTDFVDIVITKFYVISPLAEIGSRAVH
jgi:hypothetical protein